LGLIGKVDAAFNASDGKRI